ncbi:hypothetical protein ACJJTC_017651 [Scirpophaga incertulas]
MLNAQGSGTTKTAKEWSIYISNYKSKLKRLVADINANTSATGGGPASSATLSEYDLRFLAVMGEGFGQINQAVRINPFPEMPEAPSQSQGSIAQTAPTACSSQSTETSNVDVYVITEEEAVDNPTYIINENVRTEEQSDLVREVVSPSPTPVDNTSAPRRRSRTRQRSRPLAPLDEARRILSRVEMQRAAADTAQAQALAVIGQSLQSLAESHDRIGQSLSRLSDVAEQYFNSLLDR